MKKDRLQVIIQQEVLMNDKDLYRNGSGYNDPTAFRAIANAELKDRTKIMKRLSILKHKIYKLCLLNGFYIDGLVSFVDTSTNKKYDKYLSNVKEGIDIEED